MSRSDAFLGQVTKNGALTNSGVNNNQQSQMPPRLNELPNLSVSTRYSSASSRSIKKSVSKSKRTYRTHKDHFAEVWPEIEKMLRTQSKLNARMIMDMLVEIDKNRFRPGHLRTLQRRIQEWRLQNGKRRKIKSRRKSK